MFNFRTNVCLPYSAVNACVVVVLYSILYQEAIKTIFILSYLNRCLYLCRYTTIKCVTIRAFACPTDLRNQQQNRMKPIHLMQIIWYFPLVYTLNGRRFCEALYVPVSIGWAATQLPRSVYLVQHYTTAIIYQVLAYNGVSNFCADILFAYSMHHAMTLWHNFKQEIVHFEYHCVKHGNYQFNIYITIPYQIYIYRFIYD